MNADATTLRTWLITGASRGLGRSLAEAALAAGDRVIATARQPATLDDLVAHHPGRAHAVTLDVTSRPQADAAVARAREEFGRLDVVVNNAGLLSINSVEDFDEDDLRAEIETNLWGVINVTRAVLPMLRGQRSGHIIQISSVLGRAGAPGVAPYVAAKWAVEGFSTALAMEVAPLGIHTTLIEPGGLRTGIQGSSPMTLENLRPEYRPTVGLSVEHRASSLAPGDPARAAQAILAVAGMPDPPLRLLLGSDAYAVARAADEARLAADERWETLTHSIGFEDAAPADDALSRLTARPSPSGAERSHGGRRRRMIDRRDLSRGLERLHGG